MADTAIDSLSAITTLAQADVFPVVDQTDNTTKKITWLLMLESMGYFRVDASETDQGATGNGKSIKAFVDAIGSTKQAVIFLPHDSGGNTTTYTLTTSVTITSNISLVMQNGAVLDGAGTVTINGSFEKGREYCFGSSITAEFGPLAVEEFYPEWWGVDGTADDVQINLATVAAAINGGIVRLAPKDYVLAATINLYDGVRLLGTTDTFNGYDGGGNGTVLDNGANVPAITVSGAYGYRFEIGFLHIDGNSGTDDGIYLVQTGGKVPRDSRIHYVSMYDIGRDGIRFDAYSYITVDQVIANTVGGHGFHIVDDTTATQEFLYLKNSTAQNCVGSGLRITTGTFVYVDKCDFAFNDKGVYISGNPYHLHFNGVNVSFSTTYGVELYADTSPGLARIYFRDLSIYMTGTNVAEKALYTHRASTYAITDTSIINVEVTKNGATAPTTAIDIDATFLYSELLYVRNMSGGAVSLPIDQQFVYTDSQKIGLATLADDATPSVQGGHKFVTGGTTTITDFDDGYRGQVIIIIAEHATPITHGTNIFLNGTTSWTLAVNDSLTLLCKVDNKWYEIARNNVA